MKKKCQIEGCQFLHFAKGFCELHYRRFRRHGDPNKLIREKKAPDKCSLEGCGRPYHAGGFCHPHYVEKLKILKPEIFEEQNLRKKNKSQTIESRFNRGIARAHERGFEWAIPFELYKQLLAKPCEICSGPLNPTGVGLDRVNNSLGYLPTNVVPCCKNCNQLKTNIHTLEETKIMVRARDEYRRKLKSNEAA